MTAPTHQPALTVRVEPADRRRSAAAAATLATLPLRFVATDGDAAVVVVPGAAGWGERVRRARAAGARAVIVTDPEPDASAPGLVPGAPTAPVAPVVLAEAWASNPVLGAVADAWADPLRETTLLDLRSTEPLDGRPLRSVLVAQLRALGALGVEVATLTVVADTPSAALAVGRSATGSRIVLSTARSAVAPATLGILGVGREATIRIDLPDGTTARPAHATLTTRDGARELPTRWETAYRSAWAIAHERALAGGGVDDVAGYLRAVELLAGGGGR